MSTPWVRAATPDDVVAIDLLLAELGGLDDPDEKVVRYRERLAANVENPTHEILVAEQDGGIVGYAAAQDYGPPRAGERSIARMHDLWVAPSARGAGVGTALFTHIRSWAERDAGIGVLQWQSSDVAVGFYRTLRLESGGDVTDHETAFELAVHLPGDRERSEH